MKLVERINDIVARLERIERLLRAPEGLGYGGKILPSKEEKGESTMTDIPAWLQVMRSITGPTEYSGAANNPKIMSWVDTIARAYPEMQTYCNGYTGDDIAWCGLTVAYCMTMAGIRPVFGPTDTDRWMWAQAWAGDPKNFEPAWLTP